jgi:hypothetical protein
VIWLLLPQVHHRLFVCSNAREQKSNTVANTTVINITPGSERLSATGLKVRDTLQVPAARWGPCSVLVVMEWNSTVPSSHMPELYAATLAPAW